MSAIRPKPDIIVTRCKVAVVCGPSEALEQELIRSGIRGRHDGLVAEHDIFWSRGQIGLTDLLPGEREKYPPSCQRLVRRHPGSHRKSLYLSAHASHIVGWPVPEGRILLYDLTLHATRPEFVYSTNGGSAIS